MVPNALVGNRILREKLAIQIFRERQAKNIEKETATPYGFWNRSKKFAMRLGLKYQIVNVIQGLRKYYKRFSEAKSNI